MVVKGSLQTICQHQRMLFPKLLGLYLKGCWGYIRTTIYSAKHSKCWTFFFLNGEQNNHSSAINFCKNYVTMQKVLRYRRSITWVILHIFRLWSCRKNWKEKPFSECFIWKFSDARSDKTACEKTLRNIFGRWGFGNVMLASFKRFWWYESDGRTECELFWKKKKDLHPSIHFDN